MPRVRRTGDSSNRELRTFVVHDKESGEFLGSGYPAWVSRLADARPYKRMSDALNSLGYRKLEELESRKLVILTLYPDYDRTEETALVVEETYFEKRKRERLEQRLNQT